MIPWPPGNKTVPFEELIEPLLRLGAAIFEFADVIVGPEYDGYNYGSTELASCLGPDVHLSTESLNNSADHPLEAFLGVAFRLGIEQGRRLEQQASEPERRFAQLLIKEMSKRDPMSEEEMRAARIRLATRLKTKQELKEDP